MNNADLPEFLRDGVRFSCTDCGQCCSGAPGRVQVSDVEIETISRFLGEEREAFRERAVRQDAWGATLREHENGDCLFFIEGRCAIHAVKPRQCALYPFWFENLRSAEAWERTRCECPGIGLGELWGPEEILRKIDEDLQRIAERIP